MQQATKTSCTADKGPGRPVARPLSTLNDVHARMNATLPALERQPRSVADLQSTLRQARRRGLGISIAGGRHAMGGQQFLEGGLALDMRGMNRVLDFDPDAGLITVEAGATWPELMRAYLSRQAGQSSQWGIRQKQTGADSLTIGGAIAANIHGRGLTYPPFSADVESLKLLCADGELVTCSRRANPDLFRMVIGGYGLFGIVVTATIRLVRRQKIQRVVDLLSLPDLMQAFDARIRDGYIYGDFQFSTDASSRGFLRDGVFSCYRPVDNARPVARNQLRMGAADWRRLLYLAHVNKRQAFMEFTDFYLRSSGQLYWSDTHQLNIYLDDYHRSLDQHLAAGVPGTEMITELYVRPEKLEAFMATVSEDFRRHAVEFIYGTIRLIRKDEDAFLPWAKDDCVCVIFNLHVDHDQSGIARARSAFQRLVDRAIEFGGNYFLTYHRFARRDQLLRCYPEMPEFLRRKRIIDPDQRFSSNWYRHQVDMLADLL